MKRHLLVLLALLVLIPSAQLLAQTLAQTPPVAPAPMRGAEASAPDVAPAPTPDLEQLLTAPSCEQPEAPSDQIPAPSLMTGCSTNDDCPTGQLCCFLCGNIPDGDPSGCFACVQPVRKRCPLVV